MKHICLKLSFIVLFALSSPALAQSEESIIAMPDGEVLEEPLCFDVINQAPHTVIGSISTNYYVTDDGTKARHRGNFRLKEKEMTEFCTKGPFYEGRTIDLTLRTLVPIFDCRTAITGPIIIYGQRVKEGGTKSWASCL